MNTQKNQYQIVAASTTKAAIPKADYGNEIVRLIVSTTSTTVGAVMLSDGSGTDSAVLVALGSAFETEMKPYTIEVGAAANTGFYVTTGAGVTVTVVGRLG